MILPLTDPIDHSPAAASASDSAAPAPAEASSSEEIEQHLEALLAIAEQRAGQPEGLLDLLRRIEKLHRAIQDGPFRSSLPSDRNDLFALLSEMESSGGWPYIPRLQLRTFIDLLAPDPEP
jgi:hypothetical protein